jgi:hypothetical protein
MASGSCVIDLPRSDTQRNTKPDESAELALPNQPFSVRDVTVELNLSDNFKHWNVPKEFTTTRKNGVTVITLCANVGYALLNGRVRESSHQVKLAGEDADAVVHTVVVPGFQPTLYDCLAASAGSEAHQDTLRDSHFFPGGDTMVLREQQAPASVATVTSTVWYATVEDLQLTSVSNLLCICACA